MCEVAKENELYLTVLFGDAEGGNPTERSRKMMKSNFIRKGPLPGSDKEEKKRMRPDFPPPPQSHEHASSLHSHSTNANYQIC